MDDHHTKPVEGFLSPPSPDRKTRSPLTSSPLKRTLSNDSLAQTEFQRPTKRMLDTRSHDVALPSTSATSSTTMMGEGESPHPSTSTSTSASATSDDDSSFFDLIKTFASLDLPPSDEKDQCPVCGNPFPSSEFANHVLICVRSLDTEEDERYAAVVAAREDTIAEQSRMLGEFSAKKRTSCPSGQHCTRTDVHHFITLSHPDVECPLCGEEYPLQEVNAHVTLCLDNPNKPARKAPPKKAAAATTMSDGWGFRPPAGVGESTTEFTQFREGKTSVVRPGSPRPHQLSPGSRNQMKQKLTLKQLTAMSRLVCEQRERESGTTPSTSTTTSTTPTTIAAATTPDVSLMDMLDTFKHMGFTREALASELANHSSTSSKQQEGEGEEEEEQQTQQTQQPPQQAGGEEQSTSAFVNPFSSP